MATNEETKFKVYLGGISIPPLHQEEPIRDWQPLFLSAVTPVMEKEGEAKIVQLLPSFICRRPAERQLVREVVEETGKVDEAFKILIENLDPPIDPQSEMLKLCRSDWQPGQQVDDFFYQLKGAAEKAKAPLHLACLILGNQLPQGVRGSVQAWLDHPDHQEIGFKDARQFLILVRKELNTKGIPLDWGNRNFAVSKGVNSVSIHSSDDEYENAEIFSRHGDSERSICDAEEIKQSKGDHASSMRDSEEFKQVKVVNRSTRGRFPSIIYQNFRNSGYTPNRGGVKRQPGDRNPNCWVCGSLGHMSMNCSKGFCQKCGKRGHGVQNCTAKRVLSVEIDHADDFVMDSAFVKVKLNNVETLAMLDSGAQPSVLDIKFLETWGIPYVRKVSSVNGLASHSVKVCGESQVKVDLGNGLCLSHKFTVIVSDEPTVILGRDFLKRFEATLFDWRNHRVRLGPKWISTEASVKGGHSISRATTGGTLLSVHELPIKEWNIDKRLDPMEVKSIKKLLNSYSDVFAIDPKSPSLTNIAEHQIVTGSALPVKAKGIRVSPLAEKEIKLQIEQMLKNGIIQTSSSPWSARVILVEKKDKSLRFAVDYRGLNDITRKDAYPIPDSRDIIDKLYGSTIFSKLDGASAYWSIPIKTEDIPKTAFVTPKANTSFA